MKKLLAMLLTGVLVLSLVACGSAGSETDSQSEGQQTQENSVAGTDANGQEDVAADTDSEAETDVVNEPINEEDNEMGTENEDALDSTTEADETDETEAEQTTDGGNVLVAYFSWSGNTQQLAEMIQRAAGGELFEIEPETAYTDDYDALLDVAQQERANDARPALASHVENWEDYSTIFVGYPNWWSDAPMVILSFLEEYDCTGKVIIPFCTSGGGGFGGSLSSIADSAAGATIVDGFHVGGSRVGGAEEDVIEWVESLELE